VLDEEKAVHLTASKIIPFIKSANYDMKFLKFIKYAFSINSY